MLEFLVNAFAKTLAYGLAAVVGLWCGFVWRERDSLQAASRLPRTVKPLPVVGHAHLLLRGWEGFTTFIVEMFSMAAVAKCMYTVCFWCGPFPIVMIHKPEDIELILSNSATAEKGLDYDYLAGNGLVTAPGHIWKVTRRHISPLFNNLNVEQLMTVFNNNSRELVADLAEHVEGGPVDMLHPAMSVALKSVCQVTFGTELDFDTKSKAFKNVMKVVADIPQIFAKRIVNPLLRVEFLFKFLYRRELKEIDNVWTEFTKSPHKALKLNHANKRQTQENPNSRDKHKNLTQEGCVNLIDVYTELQNKFPRFSENDLRSEMLTLYSTGTDTIGLTVSSCLLVLGTYHHIQDRVYEEISAVVGPDDDVTMDHIRRMQYLDQVYKETLRWTVVVPYVLRRTTEGIQLSNCTIPSGNFVGVCLIGPHMDPKIYPNPRQFDPERFSPENSAKRDKNTFIPFSSGGGMCIAKNYSEHLIKTTLIHVLREYAVSTNMDINNFKKCFAVTLVNPEGYKIKFTNSKCKQI